MKPVRFFVALTCCLACATLAGADSLQLRNGRHLQGKYVGGTTAAVGFMTGGMVEYFATSEVLVLIFDNNESPLSGLRPNPTKNQPAAQTSGRSRTARSPIKPATASKRDRTGARIMRTAVVSSPTVYRGPRLETVLERESDSGQCSPQLWDTVWLSSP
jgi:hypothetical protein